MSDTAELSLPGGWGVADLAFDSGTGLIPGVVQDAATARVLMVGYLDHGAVQATLETGLATFHSRSRGHRWVKGETSGNTLRVISIEVDCDRDTLLLHCEPAGPTCHTGTCSCFDRDDVEDPAPASADAPAPGSIVASLDSLVRDRHEHLPEGSYTTSLFRSGLPRMAQKVGEEGVETALAAVTADADELTGEAADLVYHLLVLLRARDLGWTDVEQVLRQRHAGQ